MIKFIIDMENVKSETKNVQLKDYSITYPRMDFGVSIIATVGGVIVECVIESTSDDAAERENIPIQAKEEEYVELSSDLERSRKSLMGINIHTLVK
jgi:hypothetical protein